MMSLTRRTIAGKHCLHVLMFITTIRTSRICHLLCFGANVHRNPISNIPFYFDDIRIPTHNSVKSSGKVLGFLECA